MYFAIWTITVGAATGAIVLLIVNHRALKRKVVARQPRRKSADRVYEERFLVIASIIAEDIGVPVTHLFPEDRLTEDLGYDEDDARELIATELMFDVARLNKCSTLSDVVCVVRDQKT